MQVSSDSKVTVRPTRAQVIRDMVEVRLAVNEAGPQIAEVLKANGIELQHADWSKVFPHWLIACVDEHVIGCCQVVPSKPVGYIEFLHTHPEAPFKLRAIALRKMGFQGIATLRMSGAQYVGATVKTKNKQFRKVLEKMQFVKVSETDVMAKRLA
jgi:hypothetical protein